MWFEKNNKLALLLGKTQLCLPFSLLKEKKRIIIHQGITNSGPNGNL